MGTHHCSIRWEYVWLNQEHNHQMLRIHESTKKRLEQNCGYHADTKSIRQGWVEIDLPFFDILWGINRINRINIHEPTILGPRVPSGWYFFRENHSRVGRLLTSDWEDLETAPFFLVKLSGRWCHQVIHIYIYIIDIYRWILSFTVWGPGDYFLLPTIIQPSPPKQQKPPNAYHVLSSFFRNVSCEVFAGTDGMMTTGPAPSVALEEELQWILIDSCGCDMENHGV